MRSRWSLRMLQASPLLVLLAMLAVWFAVPAGMRTVGFESASIKVTPELLAAGYAPPDLTVRALEWLERSQQAAGGVPGQAYNTDVTATSRLQGMADGVTTDLLKEPWRLYDSAGDVKAFAVPDSDPAFNALRAWERDTGARVAVFVLPPQRYPPIALQSVADTSVLTAQERAEFESSGALEALRHAQRGGETTVLPVDVEGLGGGSGGERSGDRRIYYAS
ncbi:MAG: hypothetical protein CVT67_08860 [Actinobacteria bacterium HGW-Actinobacteria-7]|nr:MAG: hypothetical protein CVT67_08860 [Actinobacteria bacterium HGW-Actinobacteria-7]